MSEIILLALKHFFNVSNSEMTTLLKILFIILSGIHINQNIRLRLKKDLKHYIPDNSELKEDNPHSL